MKRLGKRTNHDTTKILILKITFTLASESPFSGTKLEKL